MSNFTSNLPAILGPLSSKYGYIPRQILGMFSIIWNQILLYINYVPQQILKIFSINVCPPFLDISSNYSYTPQQTMIIFPTVWDIQLTNMISNYSYISQKKSKTVLTIVDQKALQIRELQKGGLQKGICFYGHLIYNFTSNLSTLWNPTLFDICSTCNYIPQKIMEIFPTIQSQLLLNISYIPQQILKIFLTVVCPLFLDISANYSYTPQQTMTIFPTELGTQSMAIFPTELGTQSMAIFPTELGTQSMTIFSTELGTQSMAIFPTELGTQSMTIFPTELGAQSMAIFPAELGNQSMATFLTELGIKLTSINNYIPQQITEIFVTIIDQPPLLNIKSGYAYIPQQIIALKCYLVTRHLQQRDFPIEVLDCIFMLIFFILPNIQLYSVWIAVINYGVVFTYHYVKVTYYSHKHIHYTVYNMVLFLACILSNKFENVLDMGILLISLSEIYINPVELVILNIVFATWASLAFFSLWWVTYSHKVHSVLLELLGIFFVEYFPIHFTGTLLMILCYRLLDNRPIYV